MNIQTPVRMTVDEFLVWALDRPGRYELVNGVVHPMSPETVGHAEDKAAAYVALKAAIKPAKVEVFALPDGATVRVTETTCFEPDAVVYAAPRVDRNAVEVPNPIIVVENASRSTRKYDSGFKLEGYMSLASIQHVLLVNSDNKTITHHRRVRATAFEATVVRDGLLALDPPGLTIGVTEFFAQD